MKSLSHHYLLHVLEADGKGFLQEVYLYLDLSDYWFFLDLFSRSWLETPSPAGDEDADACWCLELADTSRRWLLGYSLGR
jgi:hypothetical protein